MASEDSDQIVSGLAVVHRLSKFRDLRKTLMGPVSSRVHKLQAADKLLKVSLLRRSQRERIEERNDPRDQIAPPTHRVAIQAFCVVVAPLIRDDAANLEEVHEFLETRDALCALSHGKLMEYLVASFVVASARPPMLPDKADGEASLSVYKTKNPTELNQPFLLIFCTHRIFTIPPT